MITFVETAKKVTWFGDDAGTFMRMDKDAPHAIVRLPGNKQFKYASVLVEWPVTDADNWAQITWTAVHSYLDVGMSAEEVTEIVRDGLRENDLTIATAFPTCILRAAQ